MDEDWKKLAEEYDDKDWSFSSAKAWEKVVEENPKPFNKIQYVDQLRLSGNYFKAKEVIESIEMNEIPDQYKFVYFIRKGMLYEDQGEIKKAIECFRKSVEFQNDETYPFIFLGTALSKISELDEAEMVLEKALDKEGDLDEVNYNLSLNFARKGNFIEAIRKMKDCLNIDPHFPNAKIWLEDFKNMKN